MADKFPWLAAEGGTYSTTGPSVDLDGTATNLGASYPTRTFAAAAADTDVDFDDGDTCQVLIVKDSSNWAAYSGAAWNDLATDTITLGSATKQASEGTLSNSDAVEVYAQPPFSRYLPDPSGKSDGFMTQVSSGEWTT